MFYKLRFDTALRELGFDHTLFNLSYRTAAQAIGESLRATPSEAALMLVAQLPWSQLGPLRKNVLGLWACKGKIRIEQNDVEEALVSMGILGEIRAETERWRQGR
jgi:hypothetical protein